MIPKGERWEATGKRKSAVARVILTPGSGKFYVRKWRKLPTDWEGTVSYVDAKTGDVVEERAQFSNHVPEGKQAVPRTSKAGKKPFRYTPLDEYFGRETLRMIVDQPFGKTELNEKFDVWANVRGGGLSGQAGAIRHGIARALVNYELDQIGDAPEATDAEPTVTVGGEDVEGLMPETVAKDPIRRSLKRAGFLTRDARVKERKKYGQPGARKRFQYSKR